MNDKRLLGLVIVLGFIGTVVAAPALAQTPETFSNSKSAEVSSNGVFDATLIIEDNIPTDGSEGSFGYGILTDDGDAILVTHTHQGILDSETQRSYQDPIWHNHLVRLGDVEQCDEDLGVIDITWQSPGEIEINDNEAKISSVPTSEFKGWHSITGEELSMTLGEDISNVISFRLQSADDEETALEDLCVTEVTQAEEVNIMEEGSFL
jgi:hypothetical protein